ncbi:MAG TPA: 16S rRNA (guanine(966)-N(2))-methyltransferase RsmD [Bryobacteraceae bacterium]|nr:16S rRNA (guanine(966)-N(2))-methyltransferase RsmD [Bryobacteraceae bacterium]
MRVIAGEFRSRVLKTVPGMETRPTPDRLRESLFNVLAPEIEGVVFLDAYAGSGAVGIEAVSRGAAKAILIERARAAADVIRENVGALKLAGRVEVLHGRVLQYLPHRKADIAFLDPPYELQKEYSESLEILAAGETPLVIVQHSSRMKLEEQYGSLHRSRVLTQRENSLSFYRRA